MRHRSLGALMPLLPHWKSQCPQFFSQVRPKTKGEPAMSANLQEHQQTNPGIQPFRVDVQLHDLLKKPEVRRPLVPPPPSAQPHELPEPVFPQHPGLLTDAT